MTSLPVPVSPAIRTVVFVGATASTRERIPRRLPRRPTIVSTKGSSSRFSLRARSSSLRYTTAFIGMFPVFSLIWTTELKTELMFLSCARFNNFCDHNCSFYYKHSNHTGRVHYYVSRLFPYFLSSRSLLIHSRM